MSSGPAVLNHCGQIPDVIVDCAHNGASAQALSQTLREEYPHRRVILVIGISQDKDVAAICML